MTCKENLFRVDIEVDVHPWNYYIRVSKSVIYFSNSKTVKELDWRKTKPQQLHWQISINLRNIIKTMSEV